MHSATGSLRVKHPHRLHTGARIGKCKHAYTHTHACARRASGAYHQLVANVGLRADRLCWQLAEEGEREMVQEAMPEHIHGSRLGSFGQQPTPQLMLHRWSHLQTRQPAGFLCWPAIDMMTPCFAELHAFY